VTGRRPNARPGSKWWPIARPSPLRQGHRVRRRRHRRPRPWLDPEGTWHRDDRGYAEAPITDPLTNLQIAEDLPTLDIRLGDHQPHIRGKIREYVAM
jgi:hypothetical protein